MERLTDDLVTEILARLPVQSVVKSRCVSKSWKKFTYQPSFIKSWSLQQPNPSFIISNLSIAQNTFGGTPLFNLQYNKTLHNYDCTVVGSSDSQPNFPGLKVMGSCNGLICLVGYLSWQFGRIYVYNPLNRFYVKLPDPIDYSGDTAVGFGFVPQINQYKAVTIRNVNDRGGSDRAVVCVCTLGDVVWRRLEIIPHKVNWETCPKHVFVNGFLHWLSRSLDNVVIAFDVAREVVRVVMPPPNVRFEDWPSLGVLDGCLSLTGFSYPFEHAGIWVMKEYGVRNSWRKCYNVDFTTIGYINKGIVRTLCLQKDDGELLMLYHFREVVAYNVKTMKFRKITSGEVQLPLRFDISDHVPTFVSPLKF